MYRLFAWMIPCVVFLGGSAVMAAPRELPDAEAALQSGDYLQAASLFSDCAQQGDVHCQYYLGVIYLCTGHGWHADEAKALYWLEKSAAQGFDVAQLRLGRQLLMDGQGSKALPWVQKAAASGNGYAKELLATASFIDTPVRTVHYYDATHPGPISRLFIWLGQQLAAAPWWTGLAAMLTFFGMAIAATIYVAFFQSTTRISPAEYLARIAALPMPLKLLFVIIVLALLAGGRDIIQEARLIAKMHRLESSRSAP